MTKTKTMTTRTRTTRRQIIGGMSNIGLVMKILPIYELNKEKSAGRIQNKTTSTTVFDLQMQFLCTEHFTLFHKEE